MYILVILIYNLARIDLGFRQSIQKIHFIQVKNTIFSEFHLSLEKLEKLGISSKSPPQRFFERTDQRTNISIGKGNFSKRSDDPNPISIEISYKECNSLHNYTIYIKSSFQTGFRRREYIRKTWGRKKPIIFVISSKTKNIPERLINEQREYNDILFLFGYKDIWSNLSMKILAILKHAHSCDFAKSIIITDDDVYWFLDIMERDFVSPINFITSHGKNVVGQKLRENLTVHSNYVIGRVVWALQPVRIFNTKGKGRYSISFSDYPFRVYPPFPAGQGYIISRPALPLLYHATFYVPATFRHLDDVFMGMLIHFSNERKNGEFINLLDDKRFGNEDRRYNKNKVVQWNCEQLNFHRFNITPEFLSNRKTSCEDKAVFEPPKNFKRNFVK